MVPQEDGTFDSFRIGPVQIKSALPGQAQRLNVPFNAVRDALEAAVAGLEKGINDGSSERWRVAAVELPKGQTARSSVGPWGALAALAKAWAGAGKRRTRKALDEAVDEALSSGKWAEEDETQMPRRQRAEQEWLEDEEEMHEEFLRFRVENGRKRGVQQKGKQQPCKAAKSRKGQSAREKATEAKMAKAAEQAARGATKRAEAEAERRREAERELARERALRLREQRVGGRPAGGPPSVHTPPQGVPPRRRGRFPLDPPRDPQGGKAPTSSSGPTRHCLCRLTAEEVRGAAPHPLAPRALRCPWCKRRRLPPPLPLPCVSSPSARWSSLFARVRSRPPCSRPVKEHPLPPTPRRQAQLLPSSPVPVLPGRSWPPSPSLQTECPPPCAFQT